MGSAGAPVIEVSGLTKRYSDVVAVHDVDLSVRAGQIYALLGLNGAGCWPSTTPTAWTRTGAAT
ncbi:hypothetical protein SAMN05444920_11836 [Nonomuraea solani]|uniref:ABC-2 type transport system ATP-binding protein n=2 Tax=Nonomuraea solani TaxID=1144553 RepID=A0A1H6ESK5_9ACTN|nr:hypothetical protein SAMN05444920_11836 [Nonomuraea solani]